MRILFVVQSLGKGGAERLTVEIANIIGKNFKDVEAKILALSTWDSYSSEYSGLNVEFCKSNVQLSLTGISSIKIEEYEKVVDEFKPDVIHSHVYKSELVSRERPRKGIRYFTHVHSDFLEFEPFKLKTLLSKTTITRYFERWRIFKRYKYVDNQFITISKAVHDKLLSQIPNSWHKNVHLVNNAIDYNKFSKSELPSYPSKELRIVSVGRLGKVKNQLFQILVIKELEKLGVNCILTIIGDGPDKDQLEETAKKLSIDSKIRFIGFCNVIENELPKHHIYIHTAYKEGFSLSTVEAMATGLPVVCLDAGGNRDILENGKNGFIMSQKVSPEYFAQQIALLAKDHDLYKSTSEYARIYSRKYDIDKYVSTLIEIYLHDNLIKK